MITLKKRGFFVTMSTELYASMHFPDWHRKSHREFEPIPSEIQDAQRLWVTRYQAIAEEGRKKGWLIDDYDEGEYPAPILTSRPYYVYDETEEEWKARQKALLETL